MAPDAGSQASGDILYGFARQSDTAFAFDGVQADPIAAQLPGTPSRRAHEQLTSRADHARPRLAAIHDGGAGQRPDTMLDILVIDDDRSFVSVIVMTLERAGYRVSGWTDAKQGLAMAISEAPGVVITDIFLPEIDGLEIIRALKQANPATKIIAISGGGMKGRLDYLNIAGHLGADFVLRKPFSRDELLDAITFLNGTSAMAKP